MSIQINIPEEFKAKLRITDTKRIKTAMQAAEEVKHHNEKIGLFKAAAIASRQVFIRCHLIPCVDDIREKYGDYVPGTLTVSQYGECWPVFLIDGCAEPYTLDIDDDEIVINEIMFTADIVYDALCR